MNIECTQRHIAAYYLKHIVPHKPMAERYDEYLNFRLAIQVIQHFKQDILSGITCMSRETIRKIEIHVAYCFQFREH